MFLTSNCCCWPKYESIIHNNASSSEKVHPLSSYIKIHCFGLFLLACSAWSVHISLLIQTFSQEKAILCIYRTSFSAGSNGLKLKMPWWICFLQTRSFSLHKILIDGLEWCGLLVDYCDVFISCLDSHSDGTHSLQRIHWWASDAMLHFSKSDEETNSSSSWMAWGWVKFLANSHFRWTLSLKLCHS